VLETAIQRTTQKLRLGDTGVELAFDTGTITAGDRSAPWSEIEFELIEGQTPVLFDIVKAIFPQGGLRFSRKSKAARGFMLMEKGIVEDAVSPRNAKDVSARTGDKAEEAVLRVLEDCADQIGANMEVVRLLDDTEGAHQLRVGLRRLRSAFQLFEPVLASGEMERLEAEAKWLAADVGRLRDLDACGADVVEPQMENHPDEVELAALRLRLAQRADVVRAEVREILVSERAQGFILDLAKYRRNQSLAHG
jgi:triphosphatase